MAQKLVTLNATKVESAVNTYTNAKFAVPGGSAAQRCMFMKGMLDVTTPDIEDAINYATGVVLVGDRTAKTSDSGLGNNGVFGYVQEILNSDASDILFHSNKAPVKLDVPTPIPKDSDGNFYITLEVVGIGNANPKSVNFYGSFVLEF